MDTTLATLTKGDASELKEVACGFAQMAWTPGEEASARSWKVWASLPRTYQKEQIATATQRPVGMVLVLSMKSCCNVM